MKNLPRLEVILPIYNEQENIPLVMAELDKVAGRLSDRAQMTFCFVNDGSSDGSTQMLRELHETRNDVSVIELVRNFGHGSAVLAGIEHSTADAVAVMDADLQDSPELFYQMFNAWERGEKTVVAERTDRSESNRIVFKAFYRLLNLMAKTPTAINFGSHCILDRSIVQRLVQLKERSRFFPGLVSLCSGKICAIPSKRSKRARGASKTGLRGQIQYALIAIIGFSSMPVRMVTAVGFLSAAASICVGMTILGIKLFTDYAIPGWASVMVATSFSCGIQCVCLGIIGEYIARIYDEVKLRPLFLIERVFESSLSAEVAIGKSAALQISQ